MISLVLIIIFDDTLLFVQTYDIRQRNLFSYYNRHFSHISFFFTYLFPQSLTHDLFLVAIFNHVVQILVETILTYLKIE